ncbi:hypothetical protein OH492_16310 [Vibrio chagasii]|nr:hypothetical protein [Vibrio chagasii]
MITLGSQKIDLEKIAEQLEDKYDLTKTNQDSSPQDPANKLQAIAKSL